jgi:hypothetical protein
MLKQILSSCSKGQKNIFSEIVHDWYLKNAEFMLVSEKQTCLCDEMHLKKVITKNMVNWDLHQKWCFFVITYFRCILSQRQICIFETSIKFCVLFTNNDLYQKKKFWYLYYRMTKFSGTFPKRLWGYGGETNFSMLVQDFLPIDTTISKC